MKAEIISLGTELLLGSILNTNARFISQKLAEIGLDLYYQTTIGDNPSRLTESIKKAVGRSDVVIITGGLGPTVDDITIETISKLTGRRLVLNEKVLEDLKDYFKLRRLKVPAESLRQAYMPEGATIIRNTVGTAPGIITEYKGKMIICLPGPPRELEPIFENKIMPYIKKEFKGTWVIISRTIKTTGLAESQVDKKVRDLLKLRPPTTVGIYAKLGEVDLTIMAKAESVKKAADAIERVEKKIRQRLKWHIFGHDDDTLEGSAANILNKKKIKLAIAESCTGGLVANRLTDVSGSSKYFLMGIVAYSNDIKTNILGVSEESIKRYGAVSENVALEMANGIRFLACADIGIGITGIAGPAGATRAKPVGLVYIALTGCGKSIVKEFRFKGSRQEIKFQASQTALDMLRLNS